MKYLKYVVTALAAGLLGSSAVAADGGAKSGSTRTSPKSQANPTPEAQPAEIERFTLECGPTQTVEEGRMGRSKIGQEHDASMLRISVVVFDKGADYWYSYVQTGESNGPFRMRSYDNGTYNLTEITNMNSPNTQTSSMTRKINRVTGVYEETKSGIFNDGESYLSVYRRNCKRLPSFIDLTPSPKL